MSSKLAGVIVLTPSRYPFRFSLCFSISSCRVEFFFLFLVPMKGCNLIAHVKLLMGRKTRLSPGQIQISRWQICCPGFTNTVNATFTHSSGHSTELCTSYLPLASLNLHFKSMGSDHRRWVTVDVRGDKFDDHSCQD